MAGEANQHIYHLPNNLKDHSIQEDLKILSQKTQHRRPLLAEAVTEVLSAPDMGWSKSTAVRAFFRTLEIKLRIGRNISAIWFVHMIGKTSNFFRKKQKQTCPNFVKISEFGDSTIAKKPWIIWILDVQRNVLIRQSMIFGFSMIRLHPKPEKGPLKKCFMPRDLIRALVTAYFEVTEPSQMLMNHHKSSWVTITESHAWIARSSFSKGCFEHVQIILLLSIRGTIQPSLSVDRGHARLKPSR